MGIPYTGPKTETNYAGRDCASLVEQLSKTVNQFVNREVKARKSKSGQVQKDFEARKSGGFWDSITAGPLAEYQQKIEEGAANAKDIADGKGGLLGKYSSYMDLSQSYAGMATTLASGVVSNIVDEVAVVSQITDAVGIPSLLPTGQDAGCDRNLLSATVGSVVRVAGRAVNNAAQAVFNVQATVGLAFDVMPDLYAGLMSLPAGSLSVLLTNREVLLSRISSTVNAAIDIANKLQADDYPFDHRSFVLNAMGELQGADSDLGQVESTLEAGGKFLGNVWDRAQQVIDDVSGDMLGSRLGLTPGQLILIRLTGYQKLLESLMSILTERQAAFAQVIAAIGSFGVQFESSANMKNLAAPLVQQIRCTLQQVIKDMSKVTDMNGMLRYYLKEKQWGMELAQLSVFMKNSKVMGERLSRVSSPLNDLAEDLSAGINGASSDLSSEESYMTLIGKMGGFVKELKRKIVSNVDTGLLVSVGASIDKEVASISASDSTLNDLLATFNGGFVGEAALTVLQGVTSVINFMEDSGLDSMVSDLKSGELNKFFTTDGFLNQLERVARATIGDVLRCCEDNAGDGDTETRLKRISKVMLAFQNGKDTYNKYVGKYAENYINDMQRRIIPDLQRMSRDVSRLGNSRCMNNGEEGTGTSMGLILV